MKAGFVDLNFNVIPVALIKAQKHLFLGRFPPRISIQSNE
jgi:hypothetical protein